MANRIIETFSGNGEVLKDGQHLCYVHYHLQHRMNIETDQGEISGEVTVKETERLSVDVLNSMGSGQVFTLLLADKRSLQVSFPRGDSLNGVYQVVNSGEGFRSA
jgi:hypothetical protein